MKIFSLFFFLGFVLSMLVNAQTVLLEQNLKNDTVKQDYGQNLKHFFYPYLEVGFFAGPNVSDKVSINYFSSNSVSLGFRYKYKICNFYALGYDLSLSSNTYQITQNSTKHFIDTSQYEKEKLKFPDLTFEIFNRFNFGRRGNIIGKYIDIGFYGGWVMTAWHIMTNKNNLNEDVETTVSGMKTIESFNYGLRTRIGVNHWSVFASYRLSDIFKKDAGIPELPRLKIGIQLGVYW